jgi:prepilin-type N-terminal cleavage/methylation domain-containing protein
MAQDRKRDGFTLIELMIVVVIMGVLAAVAIPSFIAYVYRARTTEATAFLAEIRQRQEAYRAEFGSYCDVGATMTPTGTLTTSAREWTGGTNWTQLGAAPDGPVRFSYMTVAGLPGDGNGPNIDGSDLGMASPTDFWFVAQAEGDLDGDEDTVVFEAYSFANHIWCSQPQGWE